jgi:hypothetical protein
MKSNSNLMKIQESPIIGETQFILKISGIVTLMFCAFGLTACGESREARSVNQLKYYASRTPVRDLVHDSKVQDYLKQHKVYVSLTSSPTRLSKVHHVIETLDLSHVEKVFLNLPARFGRDNSEYNITPELAEMFPNKIEYLRPAVDLGPITKLLPSAQHIKELGDQEAILIIIDDDTAYPKGMVLEMVHNIVYNDNTVTTGSANDVNFWNMNGSDFPATEKNNSTGCASDKTSFCDVVEGFGSVGFKVKYVDVKLMERLSSKKFSKECFVSDDLVISYSLALTGVNRMKIRNDFLGVHLIKQFDYGFEGDALHQGGGLDPSMASSTNMNEAKYQVCYNRLKEFTRDQNGNLKSVKVIKNELKTLLAQ